MTHRFHLASPSYSVRTCVRRMQPHIIYLQIFTYHRSNITFAHSPFFVGLKARAAFIRHSLIAFTSSLDTGVQRMGTARTLPALPWKHDSGFAPGVAFFFHCSKDWTAWVEMPVTQGIHFFPLRRPHHMPAVKPLGLDCAYIRSSQSGYWDAVRYCGRGTGSPVPSPLTWRAVSQTNRADSGLVCASSWTV